MGLRIDRDRFEEADYARFSARLERSDWPIEALDADGHDVSHELFEARDGMLRARREGIPLMMTTDSRIALSDCLFYLVRRAERDSA